MEVTGKPNTDYQSENALFRENSIRSIGTFQRNNLNTLCENPPTIFNNRGNAIAQDTIGNLTRSLIMINTNNFEVTERAYEDTQRRQIRLVFYHRDHQYDFPITDPAFLRNYQANPNFIEGINELYLCLSLGVVWQGWYYKLVAGIIT